MAFRPFGPRLGPDPAQMTAIKTWVRTAFQLSAETTLMVTEVQCLEEGCPPLETVIAMLDQPGVARQYKVPKPISGVTRDDVDALVPARD